MTTADPAVTTLTLLSDIGGRMRIVVAPNQLAQLIAVAVLVACTPTRAISHAAAQTVIEDAPACARCRISVRSLAKLGDFDGPGALSRMPASVALDGRGRYWIGGRLPIVFDSLGRFVAVPARNGTGPGEIQYSGVPMTIPGDSIMIVDNIAGQALLFGPDLRFVRAIRVPQGVGFGAPVQWPDLAFFSGIIQTRELMGWPLHVLSFAGSEGKLLKSSGHNNGEYRPFRAAPITSRITTFNGELWSVDRARYRITKWSRNLAALQVLERRPSWWSKPTEDILGSRTTGPSPSTISAEFDDTGLLWVYIHVPRDDWREAWKDIPANATEISMEQLHPTRLVTTLVEVIDTRSARVITRANLGRYAIASLRGRRVAVYQETAAGVPQVEILELRINRN